MKYILILFCLAFLGGCATYIANEQRKEREEKSHPPDEAEPAIGIIEAVIADVTVGKEIVDAIADELLTEKKQNQPRHTGEDSDMCENGSKKVCAVSKGCVCK